MGADLGGGGAGAGGGVARHFGAQAGIGGRVEQRGDLLCIEMRGNARVGGQELGKGPAFDKGGLRGVVDDVMRVLAADPAPRSSMTASAMIRPPPRSRLRAHAVGVEPRPAQYLDEPG